MNVARMRVFVLFAVGIVLALGCGGKSTFMGDDKPAAGGSGGGIQGGSAGNGAVSSGGSGGIAGSGAVSSDENCDDERRAMREAINENKACTDTSQCTTTYVGCGVTEDDCTGAVYTNGHNDEVVTYFRLRLMGCLIEHEPTEGCGGCDREARPPACIDGRCIGASACALEVGALWDFKARNDACNVDDDCVTEAVGCEVTEDDCTGAVYYAENFDRAEFSQLREEYYACAGSCGACRRATSPPACVLGHCQIRPLRAP